MVLKDFIYLVNKDKRRKDRIKTTQNIAVGMGVIATAGVATGILIAPKSGKETRENMKKQAVNTVEIIKDKIQKKADTIKDSADNAKQELNNAIKDIKEKTEDVKNDIKDGYEEIRKDINQTDKNISSEIDKSVK